MQMNDKKTDKFTERSLRCKDPHRILSAIEKVDNIIEITDSVNDVLDKVLDEVLAIFQSDRAWLLYPCNPVLTSFRVNFESTTAPYPGAKALGQEVPMTDDMADYCRRALDRVGRPVIDPPIGEEMSNDIAIQFHVKTLMLMALEPEIGDPWLFGLHQCDHRRVWTQDDKQLFKMIGHRITNCIGNMLYVNQLKESEERFRILVESAPMSIFLMREGKYVYGNPRGAATLGYEDPDTIVGLDALRNIAPEFRERIRRRMARIEDGMPNEPMELRFVKPNGDSVWTLSTSVPVQMDGKTTALIVSQDVTDRKRAEEALRESESKFYKAFHASPVVMSITTLEGGVVLDVNEPFLRLTELSRDDLVGKRTKEAGLWKSTDRDEIISEIKRLGFAHNKEVELLTKSGKRVPVLWFGDTVRIRDQQCIIASGFDLSEQKRAQEERERLRSQLQQAQKMESVGRLAGGVAHDFNNMLGVILGHAEMALDQLNADQPLYGDLKEIHKAARRSAELTRQLLTFARKQTISPKILDLNETVEGMLRMLKRLIGEDIQLAWLPGGNLWPVEMDPSQIDQVLANLCVNARDAVEGTGRITIETKNVVLDPDDCADHAEFIPGAFAMLAVSDNGCGMDTETLEKLFDPFFTTKGLGKGTGLGLATVYGIVKQNNGFINVYSEPDKGTTFEIYLPSRQAAAEKIRKESAERRVPRGHETVLLVEDEESMLNVAKTILERLGYRVLAACGPAEALQLAKQHTQEIHVLMTDVIMPGMNGRELSERLLITHPNLKILFSSGYTANVIAHHGVLDKGVHFIQKPFSLNEVATKVREALSDPPADK
jgi:two-component system cell cycle sensor histidine kinase/response regulator CckA